MKQLSKLQNLIYAAGGLLLAVGAILYAVPGLTGAAPYVYTVGVLGYAPMQMLARYGGRDLTVRRLRRQQLFSAVLLLLVAPLMFMNVLRVGPLRGREWLLLLTIAAVYQVFTAFRIPAALKRAGEDN